MLFTLRQRAGCSSPHAQRAGCSFRLLGASCLLTMPALLIARAALRYQLRPWGDASINPQSITSERRNVPWTMPRHPDRQPEVLGAVPSGGRLASGVVSCLWTRPYTASSSSVSGTVTPESTIQHVKNTVVGPPGRRTPSWPPGQPEWKNMDPDHVARDAGAEFGLQRRSGAADAGTIAAYTSSPSAWRPCGSDPKVLSFRTAASGPTAWASAQPGAPSTRNEQHCGIGKRVCGSMKTA
jgi:hypothetical protein